MRATLGSVSLDLLVCFPSAAAGDVSKEWRRRSRGVNCQLASFLNWLDLDHSDSEGYGKKILTIKRHHQKNKQKKLLCDLTEEALQEEKKHE